MLAYCSLLVGRLFLTTGVGEEASGPSWHVPQDADSHGEAHLTASFAVTSSPGKSCGSRRTP